MRKLAIVCLSFICGLALTLYAGLLPSLIIATASAIIAAAFVYFKNCPNVVAASVCALYLGIAIMGFFNTRRLNLIEKYSETTANGTAEIKRCYSDDTYLCKIVIGDDKFNAVCNIYSKYSFKEGNLLSGKITFSFDGEDESFYLSNGAYLGATVRNYKVINKSAVSDFKTKIKNGAGKILQDYSGANAGSVSKSMLFGDKSSLYADTKDALYKDGIVHLLAVSGIHVSILIAVFGFIISLTELPYWAKLAIIGAFSLFYAFLIGFTPSVCRAVLMAMFALSENIFKRKCDSVTILMLSATLFCIINPMIIANVSFQLSFLATAGVILGVRHIGKPLEKRFEGSIFKAPVVAIIGGIYISLIATAMCLPTLSHVFGSVSALTPIGNLICAPFAELLLVFDILLLIVSPICLAAKLPGVICASLGNAFTSLSEIIAASAQSINISANIIPIASSVLVFTYLLCEFTGIKRKEYFSLGFTGLSILLAITV